MTLEEQKRWKAYQAEAGPLIEKYREKMADYNERYKNDNTPHGRDDGPGAEEWNTIVRELTRKLMELRCKHGFPPKPLQ